ncbi:Site-specific recombinase XerD [Tangfeifania diversioriginum]|uniref:Site-specific recombinase XerD n=1 Tax=Tangfeifania diversioriginum TaxID=1168035 RepID=A0A1M6H4R2_9BACT|nr:tyrosine-type recombinase/integrase [Tangfeifania diversioriginum]SHJ17112.1 Site-specific recombinase XerD [Tangfeifania diversioriginum]
MANYSFTLRNQYKPGTESIQKEIRETTDAKKRNRKFESILSDKQVPIRLTIGFDRSHRFHCKTGMKILPKHWDFEKRQMKWQAAGSQNFNKRLNDLKENVQNYYDELMLLDEKPSYEQLRELIQEYVTTNTKPRFSEKEKSFFEVYDEFLERKSKELSHKTIQKFNSSKKMLETFIGKYYKYFNFDNIDINFIDKYKSYLLYEAYNQKTKSKGYRDDTAAKYVENLKNFLRWSYERGFHSNDIFQHSQFRAKRNYNLDIVTMTIHELKKFYEYDLRETPSLERARDLFCFQAFTGQRWGDIENFDRKDLHTDTWIFEALKTRKETIIPLVGYSAPAMDILKKYNYELPAISNQKTNDYLKLAAAKAKLNRDVEINRSQGNKKLNITKQLHEVISTHMARRTAVSILLNVYRVPVNQVMEITGHTDYKTLKRYIDKDRESLRTNLEKTRSVTDIMKVVKPESKTA